MPSNPRDAGHTPDPAARRRSARGFSLLEMIVVVAVMSVVAGTAVPVVAAVITRNKLDETRREMLTLVTAVQQFWWDCRKFPATLSQLQTNSPTVSGWKGPYATALLSGRPNVNVSLDQDAWNNAYVLTSDSASTYSPTTSTNSITIRSKGPDGVASNSDDLVQTVSVVYLRRKDTVDKLNIINAAVQAYNAQYLPGTPLSTTVETLFGQLYTANLLPRPPTGATDALKTDGWGNAFTLSPSGVSPPVRLISSNVSNGTPPTGG